MLHWPMLFKVSCEDFFLLLNFDIIKLERNDVYDSRLFRTL